MDILGIGPLELVLILVIALLVFGPDKLPEIGAKLGKGVRELRQLSREISQGVNTLTEPVDELRKPFDDTKQMVDQISAGAAVLRNPAQALQNSFEKQLVAPGAEPAAADNTIAPGPSPESPEVAAPIATLPPVGSAPESADQAAEPAEAAALATESVDGSAATDMIDPDADTAVDTAADTTVAPAAPDSPPQTAER